jgi:predicted RNase H-like nuclease (RuvC/YqgF family)
VDEFPDRKFDSALQIGWIADDMAEILPEIVKEDDEGYKYIAYAHAGPVLGEAIKHLKHETDFKTDSLATEASEDRKELLALKGTVAAMQDQLQKLSEENKKLSDLLNEVLKKLQ